MDSPDFVKFVCDIKRYLSLPLCFIKFNEPFPVAMLDDIMIHFVHYKNQYEAEKKWNERKQRIDWEHVFFIANDHDGMTDSDYAKLDSCGFKNVLVLTASNKTEYKCTFQIHQFSQKTEIGNPMQKNFLTGQMLCEECFDFVGWFNQEKGYGLENYRLK